MQFASSISDATDSTQAVEELLEPIDGVVTPGMADLVLLFATAHFEDELEEVVERVSAAFPNAMLLGCTAEGTIGCDRELERTPSMSLLAATLPDVCIRPFHVRQPDLEAAESLCDWERMVGASPESTPLFVALGDPFRVDIVRFVRQLNKNYPNSPLVGGLASAAYEPGQNRLIVGGEVHREGIGGVALTGRLAVDTVVSQGCRPIGTPFVITRGDRNVIYELGGHAALKQLHDLLVDLPDGEQELVRNGLFIGRVIDEHKDHFARGDFLIQSIVGVDQAGEAIGIIGHARVGATVQFHIRDGASADEDLRVMLAPHADRDIRGAMLFGCNGRGMNMWPQPGHDVGVLHDILGDVPVAGCFCGGEFGPTGGDNYVHGFTASIALISEPADDAESVG